MDQMRLAFHVDFDPTMPTGIGRYGIELTRSVVLSGAAPGIWIGSDRLEAWRRLDPGQDRLRILHRPGRISSRFAPGIFSFLDGVEIVHSFASTLSPVRSRTRRSTMIHDLGPFLFPELKATSDTEAWRRRIEEAVNGADCLLVNSVTTMEDLLGLFPNAAGRVFLTPPGVDHAPRPPDSPAASRGGHILMVGIVEPRKNLERVFEACGLLSGRLGGGGCPEIVIAGHEGFRSREIMESPARFGIGGRVRFEGYTSEARLSELYSGASMLVHAALYEGFGFTLPEAFARGLPVAASNRASIREMFHSACSLFDPLDPSSIADAIELCLDSGVTPSQVGERRRIFEEYTWKRCAETTLGAFRSVLGA